MPNTGQFCILRESWQLRVSEQSTEKALKRSLRELQCGRNNNNLAGVGVLQVQVGDWPCVCACALPLTRCQRGDLRVQTAIITDPHTSSPGPTNARRAEKMTSPSSPAPLFRKKGRHTDTQAHTDTSTWTVWTWTGREVILLLGLFLVAFKNIQGLLRDSFEHNSK